MAATTTAFELEIITGYPAGQRGLMAGPAFKLRQAYNAGITDPLAHQLAKTNPRAVKALTDNGKLVSFDAITAA